MKKSILVSILVFVIIGLTLLASYCFIANRLVKSIDSGLYLQPIIKNYFYVSCDPLVLHKEVGSGFLLIHYQGPIDRILFNETSVVVSYLENSILYYNEYKTNGTENLRQLELPKSQNLKIWTGCD